MNDDVKPASQPNVEPVQKIVPPMPGPGAGEPIKTNDPKPKKAFWKNWSLPKITRANKKSWIIGGSIIVVLLVGGFFGYLYLKNRYKFDPGPDVKLTKPEQQPKEEPSKLTGVMVDPELNKRPVTGVMIENSPDARPQSSLSEAGIVFEAIAEGGITRFLALYQTEQPSKIGPVRSVRPYYLDFLMPFDAAIAHAGGSAQGLNDIVALGVKDLNHNSSAFRRVSNRFAPHNLYTGFPALDDYAKSKGYTTSNFTSWPRLRQEQKAESPNATKINLSISGANYNVSYEYDASNNNYKRKLAGVPHKDENNGNQIAPKTVLVLVMTRTQNGIYSVYKTTGGGNAYAFQNGVLLKGRWSKADRKAQFTFAVDGQGEFKLNPGQTWVTIVSADNAVSYSN